MGNIRFRNTGLNGPGGIKFRRNLFVNWTIKDLTETNIIGTDGSLVEAIVFADPYSLNTNKPVLISNIQFKDFKLNATTSLKSSTGRLHKVITGPIFKSILPITSTEDIYNLTSLGAWIPNLPPNEKLILTISKLSLDDIYQIRCIFNSKNKGTSSMSLEPNNCNLEFDDNLGTIAIAEFIAPNDNISIQLKSNNDKQPFINAIVIRKIGTAPRTTMTQN